jgi:hypothetical protein
MGPAYEPLKSAKDSPDRYLVLLPANLPRLPPTKTIFHKTPQPEEHEEFPIFEEDE